MARSNLETLVERTKIKVLSASLKPDGWMDGMLVLEAIVLTRTGKHLLIRWHDGNLGWMQKLHTGWGILDEEILHQEPTEEVVNILTGERTGIPEGWAWDNYMEFLHS